MAARGLKHHEVYVQAAEAFEEVGEAAIRVREGGHLSRGGEGHIEPCL
jgi:hypothetical protein